MKKKSIINYQLSIIIAALLMCGTAFAKDLSVECQKLPVFIIQKYLKTLIWFVVK